MPLLFLATLFAPIRHTRSLPSRSPVPASLIFWLSLHLEYIHTIIRHIYLHVASPPGPAFQYKQFHPLNPKVKAKYTYLEFFLEYCFSLCGQCPLVSQRLVHGRFRCEDFFDLPLAGFSYKDTEFTSCTDLGPIRKREACQRVRGVI